MVNHRVLGIVLFFITGISGAALGQNTWSRDTSLGFTPRFTAASCVLDGKIYVIGGNTELASRFTDTVEIFDPQTHTWSEGVRMPRPRAEHAACELNGRIYVIGGSTGSAPVDTTIVFDTQKNKWDSAAPMPTRRSGLTACTLGGKIYAIGGYGDNGALNTVEIFDPTSNTWSAGPPMPTPRYYLASAVLNDKIFVVGGYSTKVAKPVGALEVYDPSTEQWTAPDPMPTDRFLLSLSALGGKLYAMGGGGVQIDLSDVEVYDPERDYWSNGPSMPTGREGLTSVVVNNKLYAIGGVQTACCVVGANEAFTPLLGVNTNAQGQDVEIFPNPTSGLIHISGADQERIIVTNTFGQTILDTKLEGNDPSINLLQSPAGTYFMRIVTTNGSVMHKLVIE